MMDMCRLHPQGRSLVWNQSWSFPKKPGGRPTVAVLIRPADGGAARVMKKSPKAKPGQIKTGAADYGTCKTAYQDNWLELIAINHLSKSLQAAAGIRSKKSGYESLVEAAGIVWEKFNPNDQREIIIKTLRGIIPGFILYMIRTFLPQSQFTREYFAAFTTVFFFWLIGHSEVRESEFNGTKERNVVYVRKCRFLEQSNCVGMCANLCKMPSQKFIKDSLGMPVNMVPNFEDMSCQMIFGQEPPSPTDDPAFAQPCYKLCNSNTRIHHLHIFAHRYNLPHYASISAKCYPSHMILLQILTKLQIQSIIMRSETTFTVTIDVSNRPSHAFTKIMVTFTFSCRQYKEKAQYDMFWLMQRNLKFREILPSTTFQWKVLYHCSDIFRF